MTVEESKQLFLEKSFRTKASAAAGRARDVRPGVSELHTRQADDPQTARRLDGLARRPSGVEAIPRRISAYGGPPIPLIRRVMMGPEAGLTALNTSPLGEVAS